MLKYAPQAVTAIALACAIVGCAYIDALKPILPDLAITLIRSLDAALTEFEAGIDIEAATPELQLQLTAIQSARRAVVLRLLECLAEEYPGIDLSDYNARLNAATRVVPLALE